MGEPTQLKVGYKVSAFATVNQPPCQPTCLVQETSVIFHLTMRTLYHFLRDNLKHLLTTLNNYGVSPSEPLRLIVRGSIPRTYSATAYANNVDLTMNAIGFFAAVTQLPIWSMPQTFTCLHFQRLIVGILPDEKGFKAHTGNVIRKRLIPGLRIEHCVLEQRRQAGAVQLRPRITLLVRNKHSHGSSIGRKLLNTDEVVRSLRTLGPVRKVAFEGLSLAAQMDVMTKTDVLVGVHGAGLSNSMFLHECGVLVEMWPFGDKPAGAYSDFHSPYVKYDDTFCNVTEEGYRGCKDGRRANTRPLLVNTSVLRSSLLDPIARWNACYKSWGHTPCFKLELESKAAGSEVQKLPRMITCIEGAAIYDYAFRLSCGLLYFYNQ